MTKLERILKRERDQYAQFIFGKPYDILQIAEIKKVNQYIHDLYHPVWKDVYENGMLTQYNVSNLGVVKNQNNEILNIKHDRKGYCMVSLNVVLPNGERAHLSRKVHRLVAQAFIPNPENKDQVNHINGLKSFNWVGNLEWNTCMENIHHAMANGLRYVGYGQDANSAKYTDNMVEEVCKLLETKKYKNTEIAEMTGVDVSTVSKIKCGEEWTHISSKYKIDKPIQNATGENAAASKYKEADIHKVCQLLSEGGKNMREISKETGVGYDMIYRIKKGLNWTEVSSQYKLSKNK